MTAGEQSICSGRWELSKLLRSHLKLKVMWSLQCWEDKMMWEEDDGENRKSKIRGRVV